MAKILYLVFATIQGFAWADPVTSQDCYQKMFERWMASSACTGVAVCADQQAQLSCQSERERRRTQCIQLCLMRQSGVITAECFDGCMSDDSK